MNKEKLHIVPIFQKEANKFVVKEHAHHKEVVGSIFQIGISLDSELIGVAICGRPTAHKIDYTKVIEATRVCVKRDKVYKNACSKLYATCARIAKEMGYKEITTCVLQSETGITLKAAGWKVTKEKAGGKNGFNSSGNRKRTNSITNLFGTELKSPEEFKTRWSKILINE